MEITFLAHSCFRVRTGSGSLLTDPFPNSISDAAGLADQTIVTISNQHPNHNGTANLTGQFHLIDSPGEYAIGDIHLKGIMTPLTTGQEFDDANTAYLIEAEGLRICHLGDLATEPSDRVIDELTPIDVLFIPIGGGCTITARQAETLLQILSPRYAIPMHYQGAGGPEELEPLGTFFRDTAAQQQEPLRRLIVTATTLPIDPKVTILKPIGLGRSGT